MKLMSAAGRYFIERPDQIGIDIQEFIFLDKDSEQFSVEIPGQLKTGDELLAFNGVAIRDVIENLIDEVLGGDRTLTGYALAKRVVFHRSGKHGETVPSGKFSLTIKHKSNGRIATYEFPWIYSRERIKDNTQQFAFKEITSKSFTPDKRALDSLERFGKKDYSVAYAKHLLKPCLLQKAPRSHEDEEQEDNREKWVLPPLGQILWETDPDNIVYAYIYDNGNGKRIGYLSLTTFDADGSVFEEIIDVMKRFNQDADALVIDITNNGGGYLFFMYAVLSTLTDQPMQTLLSDQY